MRNCYLSRNYKDLNSAGNKAKTDIEQIMAETGYVNIGLRQTRYPGTVLAFLVTLAGILKAPFSLRKGDRLVLQYPLKKYFTWVCRMAHLRGAKVIVVIHDLGSFRRKKLTTAQEIRRLSHADYLIAHNERMKHWLTDHGCRLPIGTLEIFDYLSQTRAAPHADARKPYEVLYAGALNPRKNTFLYEVGAYIHSYRFNLYGNGFELGKAKGKEYFDYRGFVRSDELIATARGDFGLVWDGFSIDACTGDFGEYLKYNNPHKTSLYIRCGLPVIIWDQAALADFVRRNGIGLCIASLADLDRILNELTPEQYAGMKEHVKALSERLGAGYYIRKALAAANAHLNA